MTQCTMADLHVYDDDDDDTPKYNGEMWRAFSFPIRGGVRRVYQTPTIPSYTKASQLHPQ